MMRAIIEFWGDEGGATALDYARIGALAVVGLVGAYDIFGQIFDGGAEVTSGLEIQAKEAF